MHEKTLFKSQSNSCTLRRRGSGEQGLWIWRIKAEFSDETLEWGRWGVGFRPWGPRKETYFPTVIFEELQCIGTGLLSCIRMEIEK